MACHNETPVLPHMAVTLRRDPSFYRALQCLFCRMYRPIQEFTWGDGSPIQQPPTSQGEQDAPNS